MNDPMVIPVALAAIVAFASLMGIVWILIFVPGDRTGGDHQEAENA